MVRRIPALIVAVSLFIALGTGCLFDPYPDAGTVDVLAPTDQGRDTGRPPGDVPGGDGWQDQGPGDAGPYDASPSDIGGPDVNPSDIPGDSGGTDSCEVPALEGPFYLEVTAFGNDPFTNDPVEPYGSGVLSGEAIVLAVEDVDGFWIPARQVLLRMMVDSKEFGIIWNLGPDVRIPVVPGQMVRVYARQVAPWWRDLVVVLWDQGGTPLFVAHDAAGDTDWYDCDGLVPCPVVRMLDDDCPAIESTCGTAFHPPVRVLLDGGLSSSEAPVGRKQGTNEMGAADQIRYLVHHAYQQDGMHCADYPDRWIAAAAVAPGRGEAMGCRCRTHGDCARHEVCETVLGRCVPDLCRPGALALAGMSCGEGLLCDPYTGRCDIDPESMEPCQNSQDCGLGPMGLCNGAMRECDESGQCLNPVGGRCIFDICQVADCATPYCSSLLATCTGCLADCDCVGEGAGASFCGAGECRPCAVDKIAFTQENGPRWEFFELCAVGKQDEVQEALRQIDPGIACGVTGIFARCSDGEVACHGTGLNRDLNFGLLDDATWLNLCRLSLVDDVVRIAGGHYLD